MLRYADVPQDALDRIGYKPVAPIGKRKVFGHIHVAEGPHQWGEIEIDDYPESTEGRALSDFCLACDIGLRDASARLGISAVHMSNIFRGAAICNWERVRALLEDRS